MDRPSHSHTSSLHCLPCLQTRSLASPSHTHIPDKSTRCHSALPPSALEEADTDMKVVTMVLLPWDQQQRQVLNSLKWRWRWDQFAKYFTILEDKVEIVQADSSSFKNCLECNGSKFQAAVVMHVGSGDKTSAWQCTMHVPSSSFPTVHSHSPDHSRRVRCRRSGQWAKGQGTVCNIAQDWFTRLKFLGAQTTVLLRNKWYQFTNVKPDDSDDEKRKEKRSDARQAKMSSKMLTRC